MKNPTVLQAIAYIGKIVLENDRRKWELFKEKYLTGLSRGNDQDALDIVASAVKIAEEHFNRTQNYRTLAEEFLSRFDLPERDFEGYLERVLEKASLAEKMPEENENEDKLLRDIEKALSSEDEEVFLKKESGGNVSFVSVHRRPKGEPEFYANGHGPVSDWKEKFAREARDDYQPPAFKTGEQVKVSGFYEKRQGRFSIHVDADGRIADNFFLDEAEAEKLEVSIGMPLEVIVEIAGEGKYVVSDVWDYDAKVVDAVSRAPVNPGAGEIAQRKGKRAVVEGKFLGYEKDHEDERETSGVIEAEDGKRYSICMPSGKTVFSDGVLENMHGKVMQKGDKVRIAAYVNSESGELQAAWCDPCYLIMPSEERQRDYNELRKEVLGNVSGIEYHLSEKDYAKARKLIGDTRALELTEAESKAVYDIAESIPEEEKPALSCSRYHVSAIDKAYQTRLESMAKKEFLEFARAAATGEIAQTGEEADVLYLFSIAKYAGISAEEREKLIVDCIEARLRKIRASDDLEFNDEYTAEHAMRYLGSIGTETAAQRLYDYMFRFVEEGDFNETGWRDNMDAKPRTMLLYFAVSSLLHDADKIPANVLIGNLAKLKQTAEFLRANSEDSSVDDMQRLVDYSIDRIGDIGE
jgi:hypothetical protein